MRSMKRIVATVVAATALSASGLMLASPANAEGQWRYAGTYTGAKGSYMLMTDGTETIRIWYAPR